MHVLRLATCMFLGWIHMCFKVGFTCVLRLASVLIFATKVLKAAFKSMIKERGGYNLTSLTVSLVSKRYMRGVAEMKFSSLFVRI